MKRISLLRRALTELVTGQRGVVLLPVLIVLAVAPLVTVGFLKFGDAINKEANDDRDVTRGRYSAEAGVNTVITDLFRGADALSPSYVAPSLVINDETVTVTITTPSLAIQPPGVYQYLDPGVSFGLRTLASQQHHYMRVDSVRASTSIRVNWAFTPIRQKWQIRLYKGSGPPGAPTPVIIAQDNLESGDFNGGSGWNSPWLSQGSASVVSSGGPKEGTFHIQLSANDGQISRPVNLSGQTNVRLRFWAKASSFDPGETATLSVSPDNINFTVVKIWRNGDDDDVYRFEDVDLSAFPMGNDFWVRFNSNMTTPGDLFFIDDLQVVSQQLPTPLVEASGGKGPGELFAGAALITGGTYTIDFFNNSGTDLVSGVFSSTGSAANTWVYIQAYKDYLITSQAGETTLLAYLRQIPGPTDPLTRQRVYVESWIDP